MTILAVVFPRQCTQSLGMRLCSPVRWVEIARIMAGRCAGMWIETGPGKVPEGLSKRIDEALAPHPMYDPATPNKALQEARNAK